MKIAIDALEVATVVKQPFNYLGSLISAMLGEIPYHYSLTVVSVQHLSFTAAPDSHWNINPQCFTQLSETPSVGCCSREDTSLEWAFLNDYSPRRFLRRKRKNKGVAIALLWHLTPKWVLVKKRYPDLLLASIQTQYH